MTISGEGMETKHMWQSISADLAYLRGSVVRKNFNLYHTLFAIIRAFECKSHDKGPGVRYLHGRAFVCDRDLDETIAYFPQPTLAGHHDTQLIPCWCRRWRAWYPASYTLWRACCRGPAAKGPVWVGNRQLAVHVVGLFARNRVEGALVGVTLVVVWHSQIAREVEHKFYQPINV